MAESFLLLNSGDFVLLNSGDKILLNEEAVVITVKKSISHTTLDAGVDLRKHKRRQTQILRLSVEIPIIGKSARILKASLECEGVAKYVERFEMPLLLIQANKPVSIPIEGTIYSIQKSLCSVTGEKKYNKAGIKSVNDYKRLVKIDTLKSLLRQIDEE